MLLLLSRSGLPDFDLCVIAAFHATDFPSSRLPDFTRKWPNGFEYDSE